MPISPVELTLKLASGLLGFPVTPFTSELDFDEGKYRTLYRSMASAGAVAMFPAGGAGELFSLSPSEHRAVVRASVDETVGIPNVAGVGGSVKIAVEMARATEAEGGDGILICPPYMVGGEQQGLADYVERICRAVGIGVVIYNRDTLQLQPDTVARLADRCPNLIGIKDGVGSIEGVLALRAKLGDRIVLANGLPTAEIAALAYRALGVKTYSSAVYTFAPKLAMSFRSAFEAGDSETVDRLLTGFYLPLIEIRKRARGYAVSIVKAGLDAVGRSAGPLRPPLMSLTPTERSTLTELLRVYAPFDILEHRETASA
ncbi:MAG: 5-dehydro-4-deoxyglucarate dehydratase [Planctomycetaceae bacterium]|jgi:5-dehydro-4-deoxyglucarate dehydratase|nr:5-dehydro-4-deoxyglucarate dehydratase [Planctomycetaceae bacterium]